MCFVGAVGHDHAGAGYRHTTEDYANTLTRTHAQHTHGYRTAAGHKQVTTQLQVINTELRVTPNRSRLRRRGFRPQVHMP